MTVLEQLARQHLVLFEHRATSTWVGNLPALSATDVSAGSLFTTGLTATPARPRERIEIPQRVRPIRCPMEEDGVK
jgi:hypothetical protein